jgi:acetyl-CoA C-acetyltransferase
MRPAPHDPVIVSAARTPTGRFGGALSGVDAVSLGARAIEAAMSRIDGRIVPERILMGNVVQAGNGQNPARAAAVRGGVPTTVPGITLNDVCLASITSVGLAATMIRHGEITSALVGGFESMSRAPHAIRIRQAKRVGIPETIDLLVSDGLWCSVSDVGMGELSDAENARLGISRQEQDALAVDSHRKASAAHEQGYFSSELVPSDELSADEGIRAATTAEALALLRPAFSPDGTITAGSASQMSDAGAAGIITSRELAQDLGLAPLVEVVGYEVVAGPDTSLHLKPAMAAQRLLRRMGMEPRDVNVWEINEAFAGVVIASCRELHLDPLVVNPHGGAIALGHPLGASGFRMTTSLINVMARRDVEYGMATICGGGGQGAALLLRRRR